MRIAFALLLGILGVAWPAMAAPPVDYLKDIKPILSKNCYACHGPQKQRSGLRLDTAAAALKGGNSGPAIVPGQNADSRLIKAVTGSDENIKQMPPKEPRLTGAEIALLKVWIDQGAKAPANEVAENANGNNMHWAFQRPVRSAEPVVKNSAWVRNPIDRFILARLDKEGIAPSGEADRITLIRRLYLDLLGLPPSVKEVNDFLADKRSDAYERLVDRLLDSPHFGECWGRHWLDAARYADSNGFTIDSARTVWPYRDWVIKGFNKDMPFDRFTIEPIAGDLLPKATVEQKIATGFHRNTLKNEEGGIDLEQFRVEYVVDRVNTTGTVFLGLTIGCCQCHDHKFDPLTQKEFYQFFAFLNNADEPTLELATPRQQKIRDGIHAELATWEKRRKSIDFTTEEEEKKWEERLSPAMRAEFPKALQTILAIPENGRDPKQKRTILTVYRQLDMLRHMAGGLGNPAPFLAAAHANALLVRTEAEKRINQIKDSEPEIVTTLVMEERKMPRETHVHIKGDFTRQGARVYPGVPEVMHPLQANGSQAAGPNRLDLARWMIDPANPLTPRVVMNRFWQQLFGRGIVETENDFGTQGTPPSHPELLDWLATEFIAKKWSMKSMIRLMVTSATYRQSSRNRPELAITDPRNKLL